MAKLTAAGDCWAKVSGALPVITLCYEVGYDAFWLARFLRARGIESLVIDPGSLQVNRPRRRVKTDRVDVKMLLRTLIAWCRGERHVWSLVRIPSIDEEDLRRSHRERSRLVRERTAHINRIKGLLFAQRHSRHQRQIPTQNLGGRQACDRRWSSLAAPTRLRDRAGDPEACHGAGADCRDRARAHTAPTPCEATERKRHLLLQLKSIGPAISALLSPPICQPAAGRKLSEPYPKPLQQWRGRALLGDFEGGQWPRPGHDARPARRPDRAPRPRARARGAWS
jgi:transposase